MAFKHLLYSKEMNLLNAEDNLTIPSIKNSYQVITNKKKCHWYFNVRRYSIWISSYVDKKREQIKMGNKQDVKISWAKINF